MKSQNNAAPTTVTLAKHAGFCVGVRRATDMLVLADWVKDKTGKAPELVAKGSAAIPAAHARAAAEAFTKVSVLDAPMSWTDFIEKGDAVRYRYTWTVVNGLLHYDWTDLLK